MSIELSETAITHIKSSLEKRGKGIGVRIGTTSYGCSGYAYILEYADSVNEYDFVHNQSGVTVVIDEKSLPMLQGIRVDYVKQGLNEGFEFSNPNSKGSCGCGESFSI